MSFLVAGGSTCYNVTAATREAVRTSIVSRSWKMLWTFHCNLCFHDLTDPDSDTDDEFFAQDSTKIKQAKFIETVDSVIQQT